MTATTAAAAESATTAASTTLAPMTTAIADLVNALRNAIVVDPATELTVQLVNGAGKVGDDTGSSCAAAALNNETAGQRWPAFGMVSINRGLGATPVSVVALDPSRATKVSETFGDRNTIKSVAEVDGTIRVEHLQYANDEYPRTGGSMPAVRPGYRGPERQRDAQPEQLDRAGLTTDGVAPLVFGDPVSKAEALTGVKAVEPQSASGVPGDPSPGLRGEHDQLLDRERPGRQDPRRREGP